MTSHRDLEAAVLTLMSFAPSECSLATVAEHFLLAPFEDGSVARSGDEKLKI
jgi:hypothetical protein